MHRIGRCQDNRLLLPAGKCLGTAPEQALNTERCRCLRHTFDHFLAIDSEVLASEGDFRGHIEIDELATRVLKHRPDMRGKLAHRPCGNEFSRNKHLALKVPFVHKRNKRINEARKCCLTASGLPGHNNALTARDLQRNVTKRWTGSAFVAKCTAIELDSIGRSLRRGGIFHHQSTPTLKQMESARSTIAAMRHTTSIARTLKW